MARAFLPAFPCVARAPLSAPQVYNSPMKYMKCMLVGLLLALIAVPVFSIGCLVVGIVIYTMVHPTQADGQIGWDPISLWRMNPIAWFIPAISFCAGFIWQYRRLAR